ncbi:flagellar basal body rod protein FlgB [Pseudomarimonas salicorniae]|uniref:Flagellar basal body rod protein FlgB n=1 Tax=Pseudomarimonas salicorniae TaxID=2933270 RepID=A0ABT0GKV9_9GAMM|nr:flagellar basal body rod protein FlgB [Lysobacter sp. CAU 1642]MCK7595171.1 flagellar basal body rod protein FlgB [Lysobacter sp. CAU 1642]
MADITSTIFGIHANALSLRQQRLDLIASNIANVDTPGYKAQDLDFATALRHASNLPGAAPLGDQLEMAPSASQPGSAPPDVAEIGRLARFQRDEMQPALDGNTVDSQLEHAAFAKAALEYRVTLNMFEGRARSLMLAITGQ